MPPADSAVGLDRKTSTKIRCYSIDVGHNEELFAAVSEPNQQPPAHTPVVGLPGSLGDLYSDDLLPVNRPR